MSMTDQESNEKAQKKWRRAKRGLNRFLHQPGFELLVMVLIIASVTLVLYELTLHKGEPHYRVVDGLNNLLTGLFILELSLRYWAEGRKTRFFRKYWLDIVAVIPFADPLRFLRIFRLLRLLRLSLILSRRLTSRKGASRGLQLKSEYVVIGMSVLVVVLMGGGLIWAMEGRVNQSFSTIEQTLWYALMTLIGGEPIGGWPQTRSGRLVTTGLMLSGLTVFAVVTATVSAVMVNSLRNLKLRIMELDEVDEHLVICGWNRSGRLILEELLHQGRFAHVVVITEIEGLGDDPFFMAILDKVYVVHGDFTRVQVLKEAGIERASFAMILADTSKEERSSQDRDARTVLAAMLIEKINARIYTVVQLLNRDNETSLRQIGVEEIIVSDEYIGNIMATVANNRGIINVLDELLTSKYGHQFFKCPVPASMVGRSVGEVIAELKITHDATLIGVDTMDVSMPPQKSVLVNPPSHLVLGPTHQLIIAASTPL